MMSVPPCRQGSRCVRSSVLLAGLDDCRYGHPPERDAQLRFIATVIVAREKKDLCRFHLKGVCKNGTTCRFFHVGDAHFAEAQLMLAPKPAPTTPAASPAKPVITPSTTPLSAAAGEYTPSSAVMTPVPVDTSLDDSYVYDVDPSMLQLPPLPSTISPPLEQIRPALEEAWQEHGLRLASTLQLAPLPETMTMDERQRQVEQEMRQARQQELGQLGAVFLQAIERANRLAQHSEHLPRAFELLQREIFRFRNALPALAKRDEIEQKLARDGCHFLVVKGQTGSGKSTQLPAYLADMDLFQGQKIVCTQPRKLAANALAARVAAEYACNDLATSAVGGPIGSRVGGLHLVSERTRVEYTTEGTFLAHLLKSASVAQALVGVGAVVIDEAHERNLLTDVLLGLLKSNIDVCPGLRVIVTSATLDTSTFCAYLRDCDLVEIPGRIFPVTVNYVPSPLNTFPDDTAIVEDVAANALLMHMSTPIEDGDILCFLTGQREVEAAAASFQRQLSAQADATGTAVVCTLYGRQLPEEQQFAFAQAPWNQRKVIFSTDVAETSVTIDGVRFVIDCGLAKNIVFDTQRNVSSLETMPISQSSAEQRKGRAGRTRPGECLRLYSEDNFNQMQPSTQPEIFVRPLSMTSCLLLSMGVEPDTFDWINPPTPEALVAALEELQILGAVERFRSGDIQLTAIGQLVCDLQLEPSYARLLYLGCLDGLGELAVMLVGLLTVADRVFWRGDMDMRATTLEMRRQFLHERGDVVSAFRAYEQWRSHAGDHAQRRAWCVQNGVNNKSLLTAEAVASDMRRGLAGNPVWTQRAQRTIAVADGADEAICKLMVRGLFLNVARHVGGFNYLAVRAECNAQVPEGSALRELADYVKGYGDFRPEWVLYQSVFKTRQSYLTTVTPVTRPWLNQLTPPEYMHRVDELLASVNARTAHAPMVVSPLEYEVGFNRKERERLETAVDCSIVDVTLADTGPRTLEIWFAPPKADSVMAAVRAWHETVRERLQTECFEDMLGGTSARAVFTAGCAVRMLLFAGEHLKVRLGGLPSDFTQAQLDALVRSVVGPDQPFEAVLLRLFGGAVHGAQIDFTSPALTHRVGSELDGKVLDDSHKVIVSWPASNAPTTWNDITGCLVLSSPTARSKGRATIMMRTARDANRLLDDADVIFGEDAFAVIKKSTGERRSKFDRFPLEPPMPKYTVLVFNLQTDTDEIDIKRWMKKQGLYPLYVRVERGTNVRQDGHMRLQDLMSLVTFSLGTPENMDGVIPSPELVVDKTERIDEVAHLRELRVTYPPHTDVKVLAADLLKAQRRTVRRLLPSTKYRSRAEFRLRTAMAGDLYEAHKAQLHKLLAKRFPEVEATWPPLNRDWRGRTVRCLFVADDDSVLSRLRKAIVEETKYTLFEHPEKDILFSPAGQYLLQPILTDVLGGVHYNRFGRTIALFGPPERREQLNEQIKDVVVQAKQQSITRELAIGRIHAHAVRKNCADWLQKCGLSHVRLVRNKLIAIGSQAALDLLEPVIAPYLRQGAEQEISEAAAVPVSDACPVCLCERVCPVWLQQCGHCFCKECVQEYLQASNITVPVRCPADGCTCELVWREIVTLAPPAALTTLKELAMRQFVAHPSNRNTVAYCPQPVCRQLVRVMGAVPATAPEESKSGGLVVNCDQCEASYCLTCSAAKGVHMTRHRGESCAQSQLNEGDDSEDSVKVHVAKIADMLLLSCPRCKEVFYDFDGCCDLQCRNTVCNAHFCALCLLDFGELGTEDRHEHVPRCKSNPRPGELYVPSGDVHRVHRKQQRKRIVRYLRAISNTGVRERVYHGIEQHLQFDDGEHITITPAHIDLA